MGTREDTTHFCYAIPQLEADQTHSCLETRQLKTRRRRCLETCRAGPAVVC